ncbi:type VI secretion system-associated protein TagF [Vitiosangium sp. GDMCC 1.1324]|uniref:type VI secretion system-associated protein TagF n=1 Tax=Vitiosangium sp. (strain GDMCC 1.1324) TaxID=2138576 RepID=UPI000D3C25D2|nr:type VI secretion system-associated protein TagF [Vitiosangium sp. GDMCC 1.1324]PTL83683.1 type VI secretion system-associated protein TagF [Vitiosangium sp. GDMCC 1.1324]
MTQAPHIGLLGKAPRHAEFVRHNAASPLGRYLFRWMEESAGRLHGARSALPTAPAHFVFTAPGESSVLVGVLAPSADSVGRAFPLAIFQEMPAADVVGRYALLPEMYQPFFRASMELLREAGSLEVPKLQERTAKLPSARPGDLRVAERLREALLSEKRCTELLQHVNGTHPPEGRYYALHTFLTACTGERHREQGLASVMLDCPYPSHMGPVTWLELATRLLRWSTLPPSFFWSDGPQPRLLLCLGAAPPTLLLHLAQPTRTGTSLWPLRTEKPAAMAQAKQSLSASQRQVIDSSNSTLEQLLRALAR